MGLTAECGNTYGENMWFPTNKGASLDTFKFEFENYNFFLAGNDLGFLWVL